MYCNRSVVGVLKNLRVAKSGRNASFHDIAPISVRLSISNTHSVQTISEYNLVEPSEPDARAALQRVFGAADGESRWLQACAEAGLRSGLVRPGDELERAATALSLQGGATAAVARSILIRMRTFYRIASRLDNTFARASS